MKSKASLKGERIKKEEYVKGGRDAAKALINHGDINEGKEK